MASQVKYTADAFANYNIERLVETGSHADVRIVCSDGEVFAHKLVLTASCSMFHDAFVALDERFEEDMHVVFDKYTIVELREFLCVVYGLKRAGISEETRTMLETCGFFLLEGSENKFVEQKQKKLIKPKIKKTRVTKPKVEVEFDNYKYEDDEDEDDSFMPITKVEPLDEDYDYSNNYYSNDGFYSENYEQKFDNEDLDSAMTKLVGKSKVTNGFGCPLIQCSAIYYSEKLLKQHLSRDHMRVKCIQCLEYHRPKDLPVHQYLHHEAKVDPATLEGTPNCVTVGCNFMASNPEALKKHSEAHKRVSCNFCGKQVSQKMLPRHITTKHRSNKAGRYECVECAKHFTLDTVLRTHLVEYHGVPADGITTCKNCTRMFGSITGISEHVKICNPPPIKTRKFITRTLNKTAHIEVPWKPNQPNNCPFDGCLYYHKERSRVRSHYIGAHCKQKCPYCGKLLNFFRMEQHIVMQHTKDYKYRCNECNAGFFSQDILQKHIDEKHVKELKYICEECGKAFFSYLKMYAHYHKYHKMAGTARCDPCGKSYTSRSSLIKHLRSVHQGRGIKELFQDANGQYKQVRKLKYVQDGQLDHLVENSAKNQSYFKDINDAESAEILNNIT